jgi:hypothetical protein
VGVDIERDGVVFELIIEITWDSSSPTVQPAIILLSVSDIDNQQQKPYLVAICELANIAARALERPRQLTQVQEVLVAISLC